MISISKEEVVYVPPKVEFYIDNKFQWWIDNEQELNNIRLKAMFEGWTHLVSFQWNGEIITMSENGDLSNWPLGMYDSISAQLVDMIHIKRGNLKELKLRNS